MDTNNTKEQAALFAKIARVASHIGTLEKGGENTHFKYKFVEDGLVSETVRVLLAAENVAFFASMDDINFPAPGHVVCSFTYTFADGDTGAVWSSRWFGEAKDNQDKAINKAATASLKYFLLKTFMIPTGKKTDDPDNDTRLNKSNAKMPPANRQQQASSTNQPVQQQGKPAQSGSVLDVGFSVESARNFLGWAKRNYGVSEDSVQKVLNTIAGHELAAMPMFPGTILDAVTGLMLLDAESKDVGFDVYINHVKAARSKAIAPHGKPFLLSELDLIEARAVTLFKGN